MFRCTVCHGNFFGAAAARHRLVGHRQRREHVNYHPFQPPILHGPLITCPFQCGQNFMHMSDLNNHKRHCPNGPIR